MAQPMFDPIPPGKSFAAIQDFRRARRQAVLREIMARLTGQSIGLLSYEQVRQMLKATGSSARGLRDIPLDAIVGSVGRYNDFTRDFLPLQDETENRWARVEMAAYSQGGVPPIEVYQLGDVYFVEDGNHRVSVARQLGATHIQAYVTQVKTRVPLTPNVKPDDLIVKAEYVGFLEDTRLDELRPGSDLSVTVPGQYRKLREHIEVHRYFMGMNEKREISLEEAAVQWYDHIYLPVVQVIRDRGILQGFPGRTETDLYLWVSEHRAALEKELGWLIRPETAATDLANQFSPRRSGLVNRLGEKLAGTIVPDELEAGPPPGMWRSERPDSPAESVLFSDLLVPVSGEERGWNAVNQAIIVARREGAILHGLHIVPTAEDLSAPEVQAVQQEFQRRCGEAGVAGELALVAGAVTRHICSRARWADLLVLNLAYPPAPQPLARLGSGFRNIIRRCPSPVLAAPGRTSGLDSALLAFDGSPKAEEALFVATYLAIKWNIKLSVLSVLVNGTTRETLERAREYLVAHAVNATYLLERGTPPEVILQTAEKENVELIIMGGYGAAPVMEVVLGSAVDRVLRESRRPMLICR
jgi:nucleotide-binding universal stress UspA family protein